jgi:hypothetical protein
MIVPLAEAVASLFPLAVKHNPRNSPSWASNNCIQTKKVGQNVCIEEI